jgi:Mce-associated membrane protein
MADDAAAPEGELIGSEKDTDEPASPDGSTESPQVTEPEVSADSAVDDLDDSDVDDDVLDDSDVDDDLDGALAPAKESMSPVKLATIIGLVVVLALGGAVGWLAFRSVESRAAAEQRSVYLQVGRQAALNLTTISFETVDADVQRILDSATDSFYDDFSARTQPFVDVVKQAQSKSVGEVTSAGLESDDGSGARVLVAITVKTTNVGAPEQDPRAWRMRISVKQVGDETKVSNVEFVP